MSDSSPGVNLGNAHGTITVDVQVDAAQAKLNAFNAQAAQQLSQVSQASNQTSESFGGLASSINAVTAAFGISFSIAGAVQLGKMAIAASEVATAYNRQQVAASSLAGSQDALNKLLAAYDQATGGAVDKAQELANVTRDISLGFGSNTTELEQFARAARGISLAGFGGGDQAAVENQLQTAILTGRSQALRELGLNMADVKSRAAELQQADASLTAQQAYGQAVIQQASAQFGKLADSGEGAKTGLEKAGTAASNLTLVLGQVLGPTVDFIAADAARTFDRLNAGIQASINLVKEFGQLVGVVGHDQSPTLGSRTPIGNMTGPQVLQAGPITDLNKAQIDWAQKTQDIERQADQARTDATQQFESQRAQIESSYQTSVSRSAQDFAISRQREERDFAQQIAAVHADTAAQELSASKQLAQSIANAQADSADRLANLADQHASSIAQKRADSADKLAELQSTREDDAAKARADTAKSLADLEANYNDQREKNARDHQDRIVDAAVSNDAKSLFLENRRYGEQQSDAQKAFDKQFSDQESKLADSLKQIDDNYQKRVDTEKKALDKSIAQENKAYDKQIEDEKKALDKRIAQSQTAYNQQIVDLKAADDKRTKDLQDAFTQRKTDEDADRALAVTRAAEDHRAQLAELDAQQQKRLTQIDTQEKQQQDALNAKFYDQLHDMGIFVDGMKEHYNELRDAAVAAFNTFLKNIPVSLGVKTPTTTPPADTHGVDHSKEINDLKQRLTNDKLILPGLPVGSKAYNDTQQDITNVENQLASLGASSASISSLAGIAGIAGAAGGSLMRAARGAVSMAVNINIFGAPGQSEAKLAQLVRQEILGVVKLAAGAT
jgi:hypothetical protein